MLLSLRAGLATGLLLAAALPLAAQDSTATKKDAMGPAPRRWRSPAR